MYSQWSHSSAAEVEAVAAVLAARVEVRLQVVVAAAARSEAGRTGKRAGLLQEGTAVAASMERAAIKGR